MLPIQYRDVAHSIGGQNWFLHFFPFTVTDFPMFWSFFLFQTRGVRFRFIYQNSYRRAQIWE